MTTALGVLGALATLAWLASLARAHLLPTGYRPLSNAISDYGVGPYARYYRWQTAASAFAALFVAAALAREEHPVPQLLIYLLLTFACARLVIPTFPTGRIHILLAGAAFASIAWCAAALPSRVDWGGLDGFLAVLGWIVVATAIACAVAATPLLHRRTKPFFGLLERLFYASAAAWTLVVSLHFL